MSNVDVLSWFALGIINGLWLRSALTWVMTRGERPGIDNLVKEALGESEQQQQKKTIGPPIPRQHGRHTLSDKDG